MGIQIYIDEVITKTYAHVWHMCVARSVVGSVVVRSVTAWRITVNILGIIRDAKAVVPNVQTKR